MISSNARSVVCPLCSSGGEHRRQIGAHQIRWCKTCAVGFTLPPPDISYEHYTSEPRDLERWLEYGSEIVDFVLSHGRRSSWLDYGAGGGELLLAARQRGVEHVIGVDLDSGGRALASERQIEVHRSLVDLEGRRFAVVSASHVLEHVEDPVETVKSLTNHLQPGGVLVVAQPNPNGLLPRLMPAHWSGWVLAEHRWHFTPKSMRAVFEHAGLNLVSFKRSSLDHRLHFDRALPFDLMGKTGALVGQGDQFLALGRSS